MMLRTVTSSRPAAGASSRTTLSAVVSLRRQTLVEPGQGRRDRRVLVAQPVDELDGEGFRTRVALVLGERDLDAGSAFCPAAPSKRSARSSASLPRRAAA